MSVDPLSCTLLAAASLTTGLRRMARPTARSGCEPSIDPFGAALAAARNRARLLHIPESAIVNHLAVSRRLGQSDLAAMNDLIARASTRQGRG